ncbi:MAG TPA: S8 family serine peptidase [Gaiellaceae bacterium]|jgi:subtilisin family serine protease
MRRYLLPVVLLAAAAGVLLVAAAGQASGRSTTSLYIVQFAGKPLATYSGGVPSFHATKPVSGARINTHTFNANRYSHYLINRQQTVLNRSGIASRPVYRFTTVLNGVVLKMTAQQASKLSGTPGVAMVEKNRIFTIQTSSANKPEAAVGLAGVPGPAGLAAPQSGSQPPTPAFLGLTGPNGVWHKQFGSAAQAGAGVIIGDIDTGFWPENPSFAAFSDDGPKAGQIQKKFHGTCDTTGEDPVTCNNKVIGARYFDAAGLSTANPGEFTSPRDYDGHGSHTASTAAGDPVEATINGSDAGPLEGMAPAARLSIYKVLYENAANTSASGSGADIVAAVEAAVNDGVDVINFSIGDNVDTFGSDELAFLNAAAAGVFVSAAAGNAGPGASTIDNAMPWETTDAAGTYDENFAMTVTLGNGSTYQGVGRGSGVGSSPLIDSVNAGVSGANATNVELCFSTASNGGTPALDPAKVAGKIVLCKRGVNARVDKGLAVKEAGGVGMILYNASDAQEFDADFHFVPTDHINNTNGLAIKSYISTAGSAATASLAPTAGAPTPEAPVVAGFSSRGPSLFSGGDLGKPDIMAPGVDMVAAVSPQNHAGNLWDSESGTSMATPHIAGIAALLIAKHPDWSPMEVKSAMMTTASPLDNQGHPIQGASGNANPFDMGSGQVAPGPAFDPGLVYNSGIVDWLKYSCGVGVHLFSGSTDLCTVFPAIKANQLNYPSIAAGALPGTQTITRTVTDVSSLPGNRTDHYTAHVTSPEGYNVAVSPSQFDIKAGQSVTYTVTVTRTTAPLNAYQFGQLVWTDGSGHSVRSPISIQGVALSAPSTASGTGATGSLPLSLTAGYNGTLNTSVQGMAKSDVTSTALVQDSAHPFNTAAPATSDATSRVDVTIPAGLRLARWATFADDYAAGRDVDIFLYRVIGSTLSFVGASAGGTASESLTLNNPVAGRTYALFTNVFDAGGEGNPLTVKPNIFLVPTTDSGNLTATPTTQSVTLGNPATVTLGWTALPSGRWLGLVNYSDGTSTIGSTTVSITSP